MGDGLWVGLWAAVGSFALIGCTSVKSAVVEFDSVSRLDEAEEWPDEADYRPDPKRYPWVVRQLDGIGSGFLYRRILDIEPARTAVDNPAEMVRECIDVLAGATARDLAVCAVAARRLLWVAEVDVNQPLNQTLALGGVEQLMFALEFDPLAMQLPDSESMPPKAVDRWVATLDAGWPGNREGIALPEDQQADYLDALQKLTRLPLASGARQRALIGALDKGLRLEQDPALVQASDGALRRALYHGMAMGLRRGLSSESARVRETAIRAVHRLGGNDSVAYILGLIAKPSTSLSSGVNRYDEDRFVRLALVSMCGQLNRERAVATSAGGPAPVEFLYETFFADPDAGLKTIALEALARCLERPVSFDPEWAVRWWTDDYVPNRGAAKR